MDLCNFAQSNGRTVLQHRRICVFMTHMGTDSRSVLLESLRLVLRPIVRVLLHGGVPFREFSELAKAAYVESATTEFGGSARPKSISRVAILTGLNRREVARVRARPANSTLDPQYMSPGSRVLSGWYLDNAFHDERGRPRRLPVDGEAPSFQSLVRKYASDLPHMTLLKELESAGALEVGEDGMLRVLKRSYIPMTFDPNQLRLWGSIMHDVGTTLSHNMRRSAAIPSRFERRAVNVHVRYSVVPDFRAFVEVEGQAFLERIDAWLAHNSIRASSTESATETERTVRLGTGVYLIQDPTLRSAERAP